MVNTYTIKHNYLCKMKDSEEKCKFQGNKTFLLFNIKVRASFLYFRGATMNKDGAPYLWRRRRWVVPTMPTKRSIHHARWLFLHGIGNNPINQNTPPVQLPSWLKLEDPTLLVNIALCTIAFLSFSSSGLTTLVPSAICTLCAWGCPWFFSLSLSLSLSLILFLVTSPLQSSFRFCLFTLLKSLALVPWEQSSTHSNFGGFNCHQAIC